MSLFEKLYYAADKELKDTTLNEFKKAGPDLVFLDLGCGDCKFTQRITAAMNPRVTIVADTIKARLWHAEDLGYKIISVDLNKKIPLESESVDVIHAGDVIEHLNDTDNFIKEIKRILKPDGYALISTPNLASWHNVAALILGKQPQTCMVSDEILSIGMNEDDIYMPKHRRILTFEGLKKLIEHHGLSVYESCGCGYYPFWGILAEYLILVDYKHSAYILMKVGK